MVYNMDIISTLTKALDKLNSKSKILKTKITNDMQERDNLNNAIEEIKLKIQNLDYTIQQSEKELEDLDSTIQQTKGGYERILEAGETLMSIVSQNLPNIDN